MPPPRDWRSTAGRLSGEDMQHYMESFEEHFLRGRIRYNTEVLKIKRVPIPEKEREKNANTAARRWLISVQDKLTGACSELKYDRVVLCSGVRTSCAECPVSTSGQESDISRVL